MRMPDSTAAVFKWSDYCLCQDSREMLHAPSGRSWVCYKLLTVRMNQEADDKLEPTRDTLSRILGVHAMCDRC